MIITCGSSKGGTGKSTLAGQLAVLRARAGLRVLLVDADEQQTAKLFSTQRKLNHPDLPQYSADTHLDDAVRLEIQQKRDLYDDIFIDVGGRDSRSLRSALTISDLLVVPFKPRSPDLWTIEDITKVLDLMRTVNPTLQAISLINQGDPVGADNIESQEILREVDGIEFSEVTIVNRKAFGRAVAQGLSVDELRPRDNKAVNEMMALYTYIFD